MLKLEVVREGLLNAVAFWFDLHLDDCETLTSGARRASCLAHDCTAQNCASTACSRMRLH